MSIRLRTYKSKDGTPSGWEVDLTLRFLDGLPPHRIRLKSPYPQKTATLKWIEGEQERLYALGRPLKRGEKKPLPAEARLVCPLFSDFAKEWLEKYVIAEGHAPSTYESRVQVLRLYLLPLLKASLQKPGKWKRPRSPRTINMATFQLWNMLKAAQLWRRLLQLPEQKPKPLKLAKPKIEIYDEPTQGRLLDAARRYGSRPLVLVLLGLHAGLRSSEMAGLSWDDIDLKASTPYLWVNRQEKEPGKPRPPKDKEARKIELSHDLRAALLAHRHLGDRVLLTNTGGRASHSQMQSWMASIERRAGLPKKQRLHILRHTFASMLIQRGASPNAVQELLGHTTLQMTMRYIHAVQQSDRGRAIALFNQPKVGEKTEAEKP